MRLRLRVILHHRCHRLLIFADVLLDVIGTTLPRRLLLISQLLKIERGVKWILINILLRKASPLPVRLALKLSEHLLLILCPDLLISDRLSADVQFHGDVRQKLALYHIILVICVIRSMITGFSIGKHRLDRVILK